MGMDGYILINLESCCFQPHFSPVHLPPAFSPSSRNVSVSFLALRNAQLLCLKDRIQAPRLHASLDYIVQGQLEVNS